MENKTQELRNDFLFGDEEEITIRRIGKTGIVSIGNRDLVGITEMEIKIIGGEPIRYLIKGEVVK